MSNKLKDFFFKMNKNPKLSYLHVSNFLKIFFRDISPIVAMHNSTIYRNNDNNNNNSNSFHIKQEQDSPVNKKNNNLSLII